MVLIQDLGGLTPMGSYFGSKATSGLCQAIIALMPPHETYIETHVGGGAILQRLRCQLSCPVSDNYLGRLVVAVL